MSKPVGNRKKMTGARDPRVVQLQARCQMRRSTFKKNLDFPRENWSLQDDKWPRKRDKANSHCLSQSRNHGLFNYSIIQWARGRFKRNRGRQLFTWGAPWQGTWWAQGNFLEPELGFQGDKLEKIWKMRMVGGWEHTPGCSTNIDLSLRGVCCGHI